ncbi:Protein of unknown function, partial [Cotesia congregata]
MVFQFRIETESPKNDILAPQNTKTTPPATPKTYTWKKQFKIKSFKGPFEAGDFLKNRYKGPLKLAIFCRTHTIPLHNIKNHQGISCPGTSPPATPNPSAEEGSPCTFYVNGKFQRILTYFGSGITNI